MRPRSFLPGALSTPEFTSRAYAPSPSTSPAFSGLRPPLKIMRPSSWPDRSDQSKLLPVVRFAVEPGREEAGYFHMPGGQSGHPLSPFYRAGHDDWVQGRPTPFLPGPTEYMLTLHP